MTGIYFHIPFCAKKCPYCAFFSTAWKKQTAEAYVRAILRNLRAYQIPDTVDTIYFGGGTPSLLTAEQISEILDTCAKSFHMQEHPEITLELNPTGKRETYLHDLYAAGVNRLSIGTQSFSDRQLQLLGRTHLAADNLRTVETAVQAGFRNISCDLMLAVPEQSEEVLANDLEILGQLPITHVSAYLLQVEEGTPFSENSDLLSRCPDEDASADRYLQAVRTLETSGFRQYEVSSFAKSGFMSRHNLKYWQCAPYLGIGAGAHSCFDGRRFCVPEDITQFCQDDKQTEMLLSAHPCDREERLLLALRTVQGTPANQLNAARIPLLKKAGYIREISGMISLTAEGFAVSNAVIAELLP